MHICLEKRHAREATKFTIDDCEKMHMRSNNIPLRVVSSSHTAHTSLQWVWGRKNLTKNHPSA